MNFLHPELQKFLSEKKPGYLKRILDFKLDEDIVSGIGLGKDNFTLVLLTPSKILLVREKELQCFFLENVLSINFTETEETTNKYFRLKIHLQDGNVELKVTTDYQLFQHFLLFLQYELKCMKKAVRIPQPEVPKQPIGFSTSIESSVQQS